MGDRVGPGVWRIVNEVLSANTYVQALGTAGECLLVDPGSDGDRIEALLRRERLTPRHVLLTHGHFDHCGSAARFAEAYGCDVRLHPADTKILKASNFLTMAFRIPFRLKVPAVVTLESCSLGDGMEMQVDHTPGHTPGSCVIRAGDNVFTGDTLYSIGIGLSKLPGEDAAQLRASLLGQLETLPPHAMIFPGHGEPAPFERVRRENAPLLAFLGLAAASSC